MNICLIKEGELGEPIGLDDYRGKHILKVLKKSIGDSFTMGIVEGPMGKATISAIDTSGIHYSFSAQEDSAPLVPLELLVGFPRPIQLKRLLRDAAALGIEGLYLSATKLGEKSYMSSSMASLSMLRKLLLEGTIQARNTHVPKVYVYSDLALALSTLNAALDSKDYPNIVKVLLECDSSLPPLAYYLSGQLGAKGTKAKGTRVVLAIGAERGWTTIEKELLCSLGYEACSLGPRILRTETCVTVASAIVLASLGYI